jgi:hypothetical protein
MRVRHHSVWLVLAALCAWEHVLFAAPSPCAAPPGVERLAYDIHWMGNLVGEVVIAFERQDDVVTVRNQIDIDAKILAWSVLRLTHSSEEHWYNGMLEGFSGETVDNGRQRAVKIEPEGTVLHVDGKGGPHEVPRDTLLLSAWCPESILRRTAIDPTKGRIKAIEAYRLGPKRYVSENNEINAQGYRVEGQLQAEIWYDRRGILVFARFPVRNGTRGTLELRESGR